MAGFKRQILTDAPSSAHAILLGSLATQGADVYCLCQRCGHAAMVEASQLARQLGPEMPVAEVGARMRCGGCGSKDVATQPGWATSVVAGHAVPAEQMAAG